MKQKKLLLFTTIAAGLFVLVAFDDLSSKKNAPPPEQGSYEQNPPIASKIWVRKLDKPLSDGSTMAFQAQFDKGYVQGGSLTIFPSAEEKVTLFDDGKTGGDLKAGDDIFSGFFKEDPKRFEETVVQMEEKLRKDGSFLEFKGRNGHLVTEIPHFDRERFNKFELIDFNPQFILAINCGTQLLKENSLLITDLSVVEDPARTYNICNNTGNPFGEWTFGTLMKGIAHESVSGVSAKSLIRSWINMWMINRQVNGQQIINSHTGTTFPPATNLRENEMLNQVITPWLRNAYSNPALVVNLGNWQTLWNGAIQDNILQFAPFKLTAIVNRIDLRGSHNYTTSLSNAGETRFIYSLINGNVGSAQCGRPIRNGGREGFNVILEYGNPQGDCNALKNFAQLWLDLSEETLGSGQYLTELETITKQVTDSGMGGSKPNGSCINQVRTNEIALSQGFILIFDHDGNASTPPITIPENRWQLLQFELNATSHVFDGAGVAVTPQIWANGGDGELSNLTQFNTTTATKFNFVDSIGKWVNGHIPMVQSGHITYPATFPNSTKKVLGATSEVISLAPTGTTHFWDAFNPFVTYDAGLNVVPSISINTDLARQQFSLNTCAGCHGGEARTTFTQVRYLGYGDPAVYWTMNPSFTLFGGPFRVDHVAPFLTGRKRRDAAFPDGSASPSGLFSDQKIDAAETPNDDQLNGLFFVEDIAGRVDAFNNPLLWSFNDLERRKQDLCQFLLSSCSPFSTTFALAKAVTFQPMEKGSH